MALISKLLVGLGLDTTGLDTGARRAKKKLSFFEKQVQSTSKGITSALGRIGGAFAIGSVIVDAGRKVVAFDQKVANLASISGKSREQVGALVQSAKDIGAVSSFSATEVLDLQTELAKLGNTEKEILSMTKAVGDFSVAVGSTASDAATLTGGILKSFGLAASQTESVVSSLAVATTKSALDFNKLNTAIPIVGTVAKQSGETIESLTAKLGVLSNRNVDASTSGTALRNIFLKLKEQGLTYDEAMARINNSTDKVNESNKLFGVRAASVGVILAENRIQADSLEKSITGVDGALKEMTDKRLDTLQGKFTLLKSAWEGFVLSIETGEGFLGAAFKDIIDAGTSIITTFTNIVKASPLDNYEKQRTELQNLLGVLEKNTLGEQARLSVIKELNDKYPEYIKNLDLQKVSLNDINSALNEYEKINKGDVDALIRQEKLNQLYKERDSLISKVVANEKQAERNRQGGLGSVAAATAAANIYRKELDEITKSIKTLESETQKRGLGGGRDASRWSKLSQVASEAGETIATVTTTISKGIEDNTAKVVKLNNETKKLLGNFLAITNNKFVGNVSTLPTRGGITSNAQQELKSLGNKQEGTKLVKLDDGFMNRARNEAEALTEANNSLESSFVSMASTMAESLASGAKNWAEFGNKLKGTITGLVGNLLKLFIAESLTSLVGTGPFGLLAAGAVAALASGVFNTAIGSANIPALASGGVIDKPTLALVGEYPGAKSNPEIVAPENKLRDIFSGELMRSGGGNSAPMYSYIKGSDLFFSRREFDYRMKRTG